MSGTMSPLLAENINFIRVLMLMPERDYPPARVREIRERLGKSMGEFGEFFHQSVAAVKAWESPEESGKHREVSGAAARIMGILELWADAKAAEVNEAFVRALVSARYRGVIPHPVRNIGSPTLCPPQSEAIQAIANNLGASYDNHDQG